MPNFECYGLSKDQVDGVRNIITLCSEKQPGWENDWVVTQVLSEVFDKKYEEKPFVRIVSTREITIEQLDETIKYLGTMADVELMYIEHFFQAK